MSDAHGIARDQLRAFISRIERLEEEKKTIADDIKDVYGEAKGMGYDTKIMKMVIALRKKDEHERTEQELILDTYLAALGMIPEPFERDDEPAAAAPVRSPAKPLQAPRTATTVSARVAINQPETANGTPSARMRAEGREVGDDVSSVESKDLAQGQQLDDAAASLNEIAPASHGEAEAPSVESVSPQAEATTGSPDANTGGDHEEVAQPQYAATHQAGSPFSISRPAAIPGKLYHEKTPFHPVKRPSYAACFPELSGKAFEDLKADINSNGVIEPIIRSFDTILDGFARYEIARSLGIEYPVLEYTGVDPLLDVIKLQRSSRDWTPAQEAKIAKALAAELPDRAADMWAAFHLAEATDGEVVAA